MQTCKHTTSRGQRWLLQVVVLYNEAWRVVRCWALHGSTGSREQTNTASDGLEATLRVCKAPERPLLSHASLWTTFLATCMVSGQGA